jgi:glyoxylase-like metal-dependent hydrolase (beta-lactamase superfamily II)
MKISDSVWSLKIPFRIPAGGGRFIGRSVNAFLIAGKKLCLIDAGVSGSVSPIFNLVLEAGREPGEVAILILTHAHPDHLGSAPGIQRVTGCIVAAHPAEKPWIEDTALQARERPVPGFSTLAGGPVRVNRLLEDGDEIGIGGDRFLAVIHTPGHSPGSISLFLGDEGVLFSGDAIPVKGEIPVYDDPSASLGSIGKLEEREGVKILLPSWDSPKTGGGINRAMADGKEVIRTLHRVVIRAARKEIDPAKIPRSVAGELGLSESALPILSRTVAGHIRAMERGESI